MFEGQNSPTIGILSQICEILESRYLEKYAPDQHEILRGILGAQMHFVGGPALQNYNSRWRQIDHLAKMDNNNKFKMAAAAILNFIYRS